MKYLGSKSLETERLFLHKTEEKDLKILWSILLKKEISNLYLTSVIHDDWEKEKQWQYKKLAKADNKDVFRWTIETKRHEVIGQIDIVDTEIEDVKDIGWFIDSKYQRKGYCFEATRENLKYMFIEVGISKIETCTSKNNPPSYLLMEKLGFKKQNSTRKVKYTIKEKEEECVNYTLNKEEFLKELFRKEDLYITDDIDKDPYIKYISEENIINLTGLPGSDKSELFNANYNNEYIVIDIDDLSMNKNRKLYKYIYKDNKKELNLKNSFDYIYKRLLQYYKGCNKALIIKSNYFYCTKDLSVLKGNIIISRTCINTAWHNLINNYSFDKIVELKNDETEMKQKQNYMNNFIDKIDKI